MKKIIVTILVLAFCSVGFAMAGEEVKQSKKEGNASITFPVKPGFDGLAGTCNYDCGNGESGSEPANNVGDCACICADACGGTCEATDGETTATCGPA